VLDLDAISAEFAVAGVIVGQSTVGRKAALAAR